MIGFFRKFLEFDGSERVLAGIWGNGVEGDSGQQAGAGEDFAGKAGEGHACGLAEGDPETATGKDGEAVDIVFKDSADAHEVVDLHDGVTDGHAEVGVGYGVVEERGQFPEAGHDGLGGGALLEEDFAARSAGMAAGADDERMGDFAAQHFGARNGFVLAAGFAVG